MKRKTIHEKKNRTSCQFLSVAPADTVLTYVYVERLILISKKLFRENKRKQKDCITCTFTLMQTTEKDDFSRLSLYFTPVGTHLLCQQMFAM